MLKKKVFLAVLVCFGIMIGWPPAVFWADAQESLAPSETKPYLLTNAVMCEGIQGDLPINPTVVFSVGYGNAYCRSEFDRIVQKEVIHHYWYRKDKLVASIKLVLQPPRWATYSNIRLRDADKGPWRVDILDSEKKVLKTLRFSITD